MTTVVRAISELLTGDTRASARVKEWRAPRAPSELLMPPTLGAERG